MAECGLTNLATCLPAKAVEYLTGLLNASLEPLLTIVQTLLTEPVNIHLFFPLWAVIIYIISLLYGVLFFFAGFNFMVSGYDSARREQAKGWLRNVVLMILFVQGSFLLYDTALETSSILTSGVMNLIDPDFFLLRVDNIINAGLQFLFLSVYVLVLLATIVLMGLRYLLVAVGVVFVPFGVFFYFIPSLHSYGKMILNVLGVLLFIPFFAALILFGSSVLLQVPLFASFTIVLSTISFLTINVLMVLVLLFAVVKASLSVLHSETGQAVKYLW